MRKHLNKTFNHQSESNRPFLSLNAEKAYLQPHLSGSYVIEAHSRILSSKTYEKPLTRNTAFEKEQRKVIFYI